MSMTGKANLLTDDELIIVNNSSHVIGKKFRKMEVALEEKADGTPVVVIITSTKELPPYMIKHVVREDFPEEEEQDVTPADEEAEAGDHRLLREPLADHMIIEAITTAANAMLNDGVAARMKWKEGGEYFDKEYGITHLAVCLFYFIHIHRLFTSSTFSSISRDSTLSSAVMACRRMRTCVPSVTSGCASVNFNAHRAASTNISRAV